MKTKQGNLNHVTIPAILSLLAGTGGALAAPPPYDTCDNAVVALAGEFNQVINDEATSASDDPDPICAFGLNFGSVFLDFVATATSAQFRTDINSLATDSAIGVYAVDQETPCDKSLWTEVGCTDDGDFEFNGETCVDGLVPGDTYTIMLVSFTSASSGDYVVDIQSPCPGAPVDVVAVQAASGPHSARKHRYVSINAAVNGSNEVGLRVDLVAMKRCSGNLERSCVEDNDCDSGATAPCVEHPDVGSTWWVQTPQEEPLGCIPGPCGSTDQFARVDAAFHSQVWDLATLHIGDCEIIPVATYEIRACLPPDGSVCSDPLTIGTIRQPFISPGFRGNYGDVAGTVVGTEFAPPDGVTNIVDVSAYQLTAQNYGTANTPQTHPTWVDLNGLGAGQPPQYILNVADLGQILKALQGAEWTTDPGNLNPASCP